jgi:lysophospholipase L1-like esterase
MSTLFTRDEGPDALSEGSTSSPLGSMTVTTLGGISILAALAGAVWSGLMRQAKATQAVIEAAAIQAAIADGTLPDGAALARHAVPPRADGVHLPDGTGPVPNPADLSRAIHLVMLGDSTSLGYGCATSDEVPGVMLARAVAAHLGRPVALRSVGAVGSGAADLPRQVDLVLGHRADVAVIVTGANDITGRIPPWQSAARLGNAVGRLQDADIPVVVGTCPDFGVIAPIPQPLRSIVGTWSRRLAALQARASTAAGGRVVMIGRQVSPEFRGRPDLFYADGFHPSGAGYAKAAAALLPQVVAALRPITLRSVHRSVDGQDRARGRQVRTPSVDVSRSSTSAI